MRGQRGAGPPSDGTGRIIPARAGPTFIDIRLKVALTDHPRSCGANRVSQHSCSAKLGSSPLVRGQLVRLVMILTVVRIIPARAGPTPGAVVEEWCDSDHPRSCGANVVRIRRLTVLTGSSPLVRGQRRTVVLPRFAVRIIPARAGPTLGRRLVENHRTGSSPLVRGQPAHATYYLGVRRIIPARAGPTGRARWSRRRLSDHPRSCGANASGLMTFFSPHGSSPLVRGQLPITARQDRRVRIIPARAGPTSARA